MENTVPFSLIKMRNEKIRDFSLISWKIFCFLPLRDNLPQANFSLIMRRHFPRSNENEEIFLLYWGKFPKKENTFPASKVVSFTKVSCQNFKKKSLVFGNIIGTV